VCVCVCVSGHRETHLYVHLPSSFLSPRYVSVKGVGGLKGWGDCDYL